MSLYILIIPHIEVVVRFTFLRVERLPSEFRYIPIVSVIHYVNISVLLKLLQYKIRITRPCVLYPIAPYYIVNLGCKGE